MPLVQDLTTPRLGCTQFHSTATRGLCTILQEGRNLGSWTFIVKVASTEQALEDMQIGINLTLHSHRQLIHDFSMFHKTAQNIGHSIITTLGVLRTNGQNQVQFVWAHFQHPSALTSHLDVSSPMVPSKELRCVLYRIMREGRLTSQ